jgi:hypothetical protein
VQHACAALLVVGCAGAGEVRPSADPLRSEIQALHRENEALAARVDALSSRVDLLTAHATREGEARQAPSPAGSVTETSSSARASTAGGPGAAVVPPDLAVVRVEPEQARWAAHAGGRGAGRSPRAAPPVPTAISIQEPDPARLDSLALPGRRPLAVEAEQELREARAQTGLARAHAMEDFTARYPQHAFADNALIEAAVAYQVAGREDASCDLARRVVGEYPAGDAMSDALERMAACAARRGAADTERRLLARLRSDFPGTPAAQRAEARLTQVSGRSGETMPRDVPARSSP